MGQVPNTTGHDGNALHPAGGPFNFKIKWADDHDKDGQKMTNKNGDPYALVILESVDDPSRGDVFVNFTLTENFYWLIHEFQIAIGKSTDGGYEWSDLVGMKVAAHVQHKQYGGKTYANVKTWVKHGDTAAAPQTGGGDDDMPF